MERARRVATWIGIGLVAAAIARELSKPAEEREWHGELAGVVPYDLRPPTLARVRAAWWNPDDPRLFTGRAFGVGWAVNLPRLLERLTLPGPGR